MIKKLGYIFFMSCCSLLIQVHCARIGAPTGGLKDTIPPVVVKMLPKAETVNFESKNIKIYFDEYIKLKDAKKQIVISPPMKQFPKIKPFGSIFKYLNLEILDTLKENTTYIFNFGNSINDNNEGNVLKGFQYVFSTGAYLDSLSLVGNIKSSYQKRITKSTDILLYEIDSLYNDSIVYKEIPDYISSTRDTITSFELSYLKPGTYRLFALLDSNGNHQFNPEKEAIGFYPKDIQLPQDSLQVQDSISISLFKEIPDSKISFPSLATQNRILFPFRGIIDSLDIDIYSEVPEDFEYRIIKDRVTDSLHFWLKTEEKMDSITFITSKATKNIDTFNVKFRKLLIDTLQLTLSQKGAYYPKERFWIDANTPISNIDKNYIIFQNQDTLDVNYEIKIDSLKNRVLFDFESQDDYAYKLLLLPGAITDMFDTKNDTLDIDLKTPHQREYTNIIFKIKNLKGFPLILQLVDDKEEVYEELFIREPQDKYEFLKIRPRTYSLKIIFDENDNKKWDTGSILKRKLPERIYYFPPIETRANWDLEEELIYDGD